MFSDWESSTVGTFRSCTECRDKQSVGNQNIEKNTAVDPKLEIAPL